MVYEEERISVGTLALFSVLRYGMARTMTIYIYDKRTLQLGDRYEVIDLASGIRLASDHWGTGNHLYSLSPFTWTENN